MILLSGSAIDSIICEKLQKSYCYFTAAAGTENARRDRSHPGTVSSKNLKETQRLVKLPARKKQRVEKVCFFAKQYETRAVRVGADAHIGPENVAKLP